MILIILPAKIAITFGTPCSCTSGYFRGSSEFYSYSLFHYVLPIPLIVSINHASQDKYPFLPFDLIA